MLNSKKTLGQYPTSRSLGLQPQQGHMLLIAVSHALSVPRPREFESPILSSPLLWFAQNRLATRNFVEYANLYISDPTEVLFFIKKCSLLSWISWDFRLSPFYFEYSKAGGASTSLNPARSPSAQNGTPSRTGKRQRWQPQVTVTNSNSSSSSSSTAAAAAGACVHILSVQMPSITTSPSRQTPHHTLQQRQPPKHAQKSHKTLIDNFHSNCTQRDNAQMYCIA